MAQTLPDEPPPLTTGAGRPSLPPLLALAGLAVLAYGYGLGSEHIPKNGDEYAYEHVARVTAGSGALLPLRSDIPSLRNTKPPLLFWQGIASTGGGRDWTLTRLRWPSVAYTLLTAALVFAVGRRLSGRAGTGLVALLAFLAFFSTYRYGRPFLTNPPEVFWLFLPFAALVLWRPALERFPVVAAVLTGTSIGVALLYKSFALALPAGLALAGWQLHARGGSVRAFLARDAWRLALALGIALAMFASWFVLDPFPGHVFRDFVLRENAGKFTLPGGYLPRLLWGTSSLLSLAFGYPQNAGLLAFPVLGLFALAWRRRRELDEGETRLWILVLTFLAVYALPSQRSSRYLLPAMPALAVLLALRWEQIARWLFGLSLAASGAVVAALGLLSWRIQQAAPEARSPAPLGWLALAATAAVVLAGLAAPALTRRLAAAAVFLVYLSFALALRPFDGPAGRFDQAARDAARGRDVHVPYDFVAKEERYRFLLPGAHPVGYPARGPAAPESMPTDALVAYPAPVRGGACAGCTVLGRRLDLRGRQTADELREVVRGNVSPALLVEELLVATPRAAPPAREVVRAGDRR